MGEQIKTQLICLQFGLTNQPTELLKFILAFRPHSNLPSVASIVSAKPFGTLSGLLA